MFMHHRFVPGLAIHSYMVGDEKTKKCAVIDPTRDIDEYISIAKTEGLRIAHILETHVHADFVSGARELKARLGGTPQVHSSGLGGKQWTPPYADHVVTDGHEFREWPAWVGFTPASFAYPILGFAGCLQFFTATFHGDLEEVESLRDAGLRDEREQEAAQGLARDTLEDGSSGDVGAGPSAPIPAQQPARQVRDGAAIS